MATIHVNTDTMRQLAQAYLNWNNTLQSQMLPQLLRPMLREARREGTSIGGAKWSASTSRSIRAVRTPGAALMHKRCHFPGIMPREVPSQANLLRAQTFYRMHSSFSPPTFEKPCH